MIDHRLRRFASALSVVGVASCVTGMWTSRVVAHDGNSDPNAIHACVGAAGQVRIVEPNGSCRPAERAAHWAIAGPPGPATPLTSFDSLAGLVCTRDGSTGSIALLYAANGDATLRCVLPVGPPSGPDQYEPNDSDLQTTALGSRDGDDTCGVAPSSSLVVQASLHAESDVDWYRITAVEGTSGLSACNLKVAAELSGVADGSALTVELYQGTPSNLVDSGGQVEATVSDNVFGGDDTTSFLIAVRRVSGPASNYTLTIEWY